MIICIFLSFFITFLAIPAIIRVADQKKLFDEPDARKLHKKAIASLGGVGIFMGFVISLLLTAPMHANASLQYILAAGTIIFFLGIKDDILILSPLKKFLIQLAAAGILIHLAGIRIESMHGLFGVAALPKVVVYFLSYSTIIVVINAFNLIDGVDGLAGSLGLLTMVVFGTYFWAIGYGGWAMLAFSMAGSVLAFLYFNFNPAKIFMGDSGSLLLGMVNAILVIKFIEIAGAPVSPAPVSSSVALGVAILAVPLADTLRVFSIRIFTGRSPFSPDRNHIHHLLLDRGFTPKQVTFACVGVNVFFIGFAWVGRAAGSAAVLLFLAALAVVLLSALVYAKKPATRFIPAAKPLPSGTEIILNLPASAPKIVNRNAEMAVAEN